MDDARERIGTAISTALKEIKPISISINWNLPSTCILVLSFFSPRGKLACSLIVHKDDEMDMGLVLLMLMNCSFARLSNQMKRNDYSFTSLVILCIVNLSFDWCLDVLVDKMTCLLISYDMCFHWLLAAFWGADFSLRRFLRKHSGALALMEIQSRVFQTRLIHVGICDWVLCSELDTCSPLFTYPRTCISFFVLL